MEKTVTATMLFADLISSTEMAKNLTLQEYDEMLVDFQSTLFEVMSNHLRVFGYRGNGVGINCGKVIKDVRGWRLNAGQKQPVIEGYAINVTKRIESASREGSVYKIMVGDSLFRFCTEESQMNIVFSQAILRKHFDQLSRPRGGTEENSPPEQLIEGVVKKWKTIIRL